MYIVAFNSCIVYSNITCTTLYVHMYLYMYMYMYIYTCDICSFLHPLVIVQDVLSLHASSDQHMREVQEIVIKKSNTYIHTYIHNVNLGYTVLMRPNRSKQSVFRLSTVALSRNNYFIFC